MLRNEDEYERIFKKVFPNKCRYESDLPKQEDMPASFDIDALISKIQSVEYLQKNFSMKYCFKYYDKIMSGFYDKYQDNATKQKKSSGFVEHRDYSKTNLNDLFDDLETIEF